MPSLSLSIRPAAPSDAPAMLEIYRPYVAASAISFEEVVPTVDEYAARIQKYVNGWAGVVAEADGQLLGYAYGSAHRERAAYKWSVETTVYVARSAQRLGVGRGLYAVLLPQLAQSGYCNAYAGVALPNAASVGLHQAMGFKSIGTFPRVGYKFCQWWDVEWFHLQLREEPDLRGAESAA